MRVSLLLPVTFLMAGSGLFAETPSAGSAFAALKLLPHGEAKRVARIEARDGTPVPDRWYILVNDPKDENGLHEYVVAGGVVAASRNVSQFAEIVRPADVFGGETLRVDSDRVAKIARMYADANAATVATMNYELKKDGTGAALMWNVTCLDEEGKEVGHIYITANKGNVVSHEGFTAEPITPSEKPKDVAVRTVRAVPVKTAQATPEPAKKPGLLDRVGKFFSGKDPNHPNGQ